MVFKNSIHNLCEQHHCRHSNDEHRFLIYMFQMISISVQS